MPAAERAVTGAEGPGTGEDGQAFGPAGAHQTVAGIGQQGRARIRDQGQVLSLAQQAQDLFLPFALVVVMETQEAAGRDVALAAQQPARRVSSAG